MIGDRQERDTAVEGYSGAVVCSAPEIQSLQRLVRCSPLRDHTALDPEVFLGSVSEGWTPRVVAVRRGIELAGIVCAKERIFRGHSLGIVYADLTLGSILSGDLVEQQNAFLAALEALLASPGTRGIRLRIRPRGPELAAVRKLLACRRLDVHFSRVKDHASLSLPGTYEQLLLSFGSTTRHNFRHYRRRFETAGHAYLQNLSPDELRLAALALEPKCSKPCRLDSIDRVVRMAGAADRPLAVGLKHRDGEWLSVIGGVCTPASAVLMLQLNNDRDFPRDSLSLVLRAYLIESLIQQGMKEFIVWGGTAPPLSRYAPHIPTVGVYLDSPEYKWRLVRGLLSEFGSWLPKRLKADARWIAPFSA